MNDLIKKWVNEQLQLSVDVTNLEKDFANGYLFGEIFSRYNQQSDFYQFSEKDDLKDKTHNFNLLEPTFKRLGVDFTTKTCELIMNQERGVVLRILYQIKMALEKLNNHQTEPLEIDTPKSPRSIVPVKPPIKFGCEKLERAESRFALHRLSIMHRSTKTISMENRMTKFEQFRQKSVEKANLKAIKNEERETQSRDERRKIQLEVFHKQKAGVENLEARTLTFWTNTQERKREKEEKDRMFIIKTQMKIKQKEVALKKQERVETLQSIESFEAYARKHWFAAKDDEDDE